MYSFDDVNLANIVVHSAGNKQSGETLQLSEDVLKFEDNVVQSEMISKIVGSEDIRIFIKGK